MQVKLTWATPDGDSLVAYMARVSNPEGQANPNSERLIRYLIDHKHWSPFEMVAACFEIETTRDIGRQILRHRSFKYQEFSQRYQSVDKLAPIELRECRLQDPKNRQNSIEVTDCIHDGVLGHWDIMQIQVYGAAMKAYRQAIDMGVAKEQARALLPEGLTPSRMYMHGDLRSWIHYIQVRADPSTQKEHRLIAEEIKDALMVKFPQIMGAAFNA